MAQIQQLTALTFAGDESETPSQARAAEAAGSAAAAAAAQPHIAPHNQQVVQEAAALSDRIHQIETIALLGLMNEGAATVQPPAANALPGTAQREAPFQPHFGGARGDASDWATTFIAEARQAIDAAHSLAQPPLADAAAATAPDTEAAGAAAASTSGEWFPDVLLPLMAMPKVQVRFVVSRSLLTTFGGITGRSHTDAHTDMNKAGLAACISSSLHYQKCFFPCRGLYFMLCRSCTAWLSPVDQQCTLAASPTPAEHPP